MLQYTYILLSIKKNIILEYIIVQISYLIWNEIVKMWQLISYLELIITRSEVDI